MGEGVELGEGGPALGPQRVRLVQDLRNPPLHAERWDRDLDLVEMLIAKVVNVDTRCERGHSLAVLFRAEKVCKVSRIDIWSGTQNFAKRTEAAFVIIQSSGRFADNIEAPARSGDYDVVSADLLLC